MSTKKWGFLKNLKHPIAKKQKIYTIKSIDFLIIKNMGGLKKISSILFTKKAFKKLIAYGLLILFLYLFRDFLGVFLLTFVFSYLFFSMGKYICQKLEYGGKRFSKLRFLSKTPLWLVILLEYFIFIGLIIYLVSNIIPTLKVELDSIVNDFSIEKSVNNTIEINTTGNNIGVKESGSKKIIGTFNNVRESFLGKLILIDPEDNLNLRDSVENFEAELDMKSIYNSVGNALSALGNSILKVMLAIILSFIFIIDRKKLGKYLYKVKESNFGFLYHEYELILDKVLKSFGLIIKAQSMIAFANAVLTVIGLLLIGFVSREAGVSSFPYIMTLGLVVFIFGFVPILGVILSSIPIMIVAYAAYQDPMVLVMIVLLIIIIHMVEAYYLNPKIVSRFFELPVSLTFIILIVSEHFFGLAGLLIGVSMFYFMVGLFKDFNEVLEKKQRKKHRKKLIGE